MTDIPTALEDAQAHLAAVLLQTVPTDDATMMGHVRDAHALIRTVRRQLADPPRYVPGSQGPHPRPASHLQAVGMRCEDTMLPCATLAAINGDDPEAA